MLQLPHTEEAKQEMIEKLKEYYRNNNKQLKWIDKFNREYKSEDAIRWYTREPFLYKQLNRALRTEDIELLFICRYFISDVSKQLLQQYLFLQDVFSSKISFYRGVILSDEEVHKLKINVGKFISTNGYLSTSLSKDVALSYINPSACNENNVLFEIEYDFDKIDSIVIASVAQFSQHPSEKEILFDLDAAFEITSMTRDVSLNLTHIKMSVTDEGATIVREHLNEIRKDMSVSSVVLVFGRLLAQIGQYEKSQFYFDRLLINPGGEDVSYIYYYMGAAQGYKGNYDKALEYYQRAYEMMVNTQIHREFPSSYVLNDIGVIYKMQGQCKNALDYFEQALRIREKYPEYLPIAASLENLAAIYRVNGDYDRALESLTACLRIREEYLAKEHRQTAKTLSNIGDILMEKDQLDVALEYHQRSLKISEKTLPVEHDDIALVLNRMALVLTNQGKFQAALDYYTRALNIREQVLPHAHLNMATTLSGIGYVYYSTAKYIRAREYLEKALQIRDRSFRNINDTGLVNTLTYLALVFIKLRQYDDALIYCRRALQTAQIVYPIGHLRVTDCLTNLGICFREMADYKTAFDYFEKASKNEEATRGKFNQLSLARTYDNMGICLLYEDDEEKGLNYRMKAVRMMVHIFPRPSHADWISTIGDAFFIKDQFDCALECYFQTLSIRRQCLPDDHLDIAQSFTDIGDVFIGMKKNLTPDGCEHYSIKARFYYEKALSIYQTLHHPNTVDMFNRLGSMYEDMQNYHRALYYYRQALTLYEKNQPFRNIDKETLEDNIARVLWLMP